MGSASCLVDFSLLPAGWPRAEGGELVAPRPYPAAILQACQREWLAKLVSRPAVLGKSHYPFSPSQLGNNVGFVVQGSQSLGKRGGWFKGRQWICAGMLRMRG